MFRVFDFFDFSILYEQRPRCLKTLDLALSITIHTHWKLINTNNLKIVPIINFKSCLQTLGPGSKTLCISKMNCFCNISWDIKTIGTYALRKKNNFRLGIVTETHRAKDSCTLYVCMFICALLCGFIHIIQCYSFINIIRVDADNRRPPHL
jgi:hypothetical protein